MKTLKQFVLRMLPKIFIMPVMLLLAGSLSMSVLARSVPESAILPVAANKDNPLTTLPIAPDFKFTHLSLEDGLSQTTVIAILEDQLGFLWLTSWYEGLTRFDPRTEQFVNYRHNPENTQSLGNDLTYVVHEDRDGTLWIGTDGGLDRFDRKTETFKHYTEKDGLPNNVIYAIMEDASSNLWVSTNSGVSKFDPRAAGHTCSHCPKTVRYGSPARSLKSIVVRATSQGQKAKDVQTQ